MRPSLRIGTVYDFRNTAASGLDEEVDENVFDRIESSQKGGPAR